jgi:hypothetical protein
LLLFQAEEDSNGGVDVENENATSNTDVNATDELIHRERSPLGHGNGIDSEMKTEQCGDENKERNLQFMQERMHATDSTFHSFVPKNGSAVNRVFGN